MQRLAWLSQSQAQIRLTQVALSSKLSQPLGVHSVQFQVGAALQNTSSRTPPATPCPHHVHPILTQYVPHTQPIHAPCTHYDEQVPPLLEVGSHGMSHSKLSGKGTTVALVSVGARHPQQLPCASTSPVWSWVAMLQGVRRIASHGRHTHLFSR